MGPPIVASDQGWGKGTFIPLRQNYKDKEGNTQERKEWHRVTLFGRQAEIAGEYLRKGSQVYIEGRIQTEKYTDKEGVERYTTKIIGDRLQLLGRRSEDGGASDGHSGTSQGSTGGGGGHPAPMDDSGDDEIPFDGGRSDLS